MAVYYSSSMIYVTSATDIKQRLQRVRDIIASLYVAMGSAAANTGIEEYSLNDGQTIISEKYRNPDAIRSAIKGFEALENNYLNKLNGRVIRLVDEGELKFRRRRSR